MQEILFRGFRKQEDGPDTAVIDGVPVRGRWIYGDLSFHVQGGIPHVFPADGYDSADCYRVDPSTVGQYTGLTDKNGKKIFEGDRVIYPVPSFENDSPSESATGVIEFHRGAFVVRWDGDVMRPRNASVYIPNIASVGTIYDTPPEAAP